MRRCSNRNMAATQTTFQDATIGSLRDFLDNNNTTTEEPQVAEGPCNITDDWNCTDIQATVDHYGHPFCASISITGVIFNLVVIFVIRQSMLMTGRRTQAQIHLLALAFSDIGVGVAYVSRAIFSWMCDFCLPCSRAKTCLR